jgi:hypothetical protein
MNETLRTRILMSLLKYSEAHEFQAQFQNKDDDWFRLFVQTIDESPYGLEDWLDAFFVFDQWCTTNRRFLDLEQQRGYLECCIEGLNPTAPTIPLKDGLRHYLDKNGVDAHHS